MRVEVHDLQPPERAVTPKAAVDAASRRALARPSSAAAAAAVSNPAAASRATSAPKHSYGTRSAGLVLEAAATAVAATTAAANLSPGGEDASRPPAAPAVPKLPASAAEGSADAAAQEETPAAPTDEQSTPAPDTSPVAATELPATGTTGAPAAGADQDVRARLAALERAGATLLSVNKSLKDKIAALEADQKRSRRRVRELVKFAQKAHARQRKMADCVGSLSALRTQLPDDVKETCADLLAAPLRRLAATEAKATAVDRLVNERLADVSGAAVLIHEAGKSDKLLHSLKDKVDSLQSKQKDLEKRLAQGSTPAPTVEPTRGRSRDRESDGAPQEGGSGSRGSLAAKERIPPAVVAAQQLQERQLPPRPRQLPPPPHQLQLQPLSQLEVPAVQPEQPQSYAAIAGSRLGGSDLESSKLVGEPVRDDLRRPNRDVQFGPAAAWPAATGCAASRPPPKTPARAACNSAANPVRTATPGMPPAAAAPPSGHEEANAALQRWNELCDDVREADAAYMQAVEARDSLKAGGAQDNDGALKAARLHVRRVRYVRHDTVAERNRACRQLGVLVGQTELARILRRQQLGLPLQGPRSPPPPLPRVLARPAGAPTTATPAPWAPAPAAQHVTPVAAAGSAPGMTQELAELLRVQTALMQRMTAMLSPQQPGSAPATGSRG